MRSPGLDTSAGRGLTVKREKRNVVQGAVRNDDEPFRLTRVCTGAIRNR